MGKENDRRGTDAARQARTLSPVPIDTNGRAPRPCRCRCGRSALDCRSAWERVPRVSAPPFRVVNISPTVFDLGIEEHRIEGQTVRIYSLARTVADCFRFRNKIGLDVALEALTEAWRSKRLKLDELNRIAKKLRVQRVMQPYLETVVM